VDGRLNQASNKLEDAWALLRILESARDALTFKAAYAALFVACRSIPDAIDRELKPLLRKERKPPLGAADFPTTERGARQRSKNARSPGACWSSFRTLGTRTCMRESTSSNSLRVTSVRA
jgi:hypothetical protein